MSGSCERLPFSRSSFIMKRGRKVGLISFIFRTFVLLLSFGITAQIFGSVTSGTENRELETRKTSRAPHKVRICGRNLAAVITYKCKDRRLRTAGLHVPNGVTMNHIPRTNAIQKTSPETLQNQEQHHNRHARHKRSWLGVVQECCTQPCYESQLLKYCSLAPDFGSMIEESTTTPLPDAVSHVDHDNSTNDISTRMSVASTQETEDFISSVAELVPLLLELVYGVSSDPRATLFHYHPFTSGSEDHQQHQQNSRRGYARPRAHSRRHHNLGPYHLHGNRKIVISALTEGTPAPAVTNVDFGKGLSLPINSDETRRDVESYEELAPLPAQYVTETGLDPDLYAFAVPTDQVQMSTESD